MIAEAPLPRREHDLDEFVEQEVILRLVVSADPGAEGHTTHVGVRQQATVVIERTNAITEFVDIVFVVTVGKGCCGSKAFFGFTRDAIEDFLCASTGLTGHSVDTETVRQFAAFLVKRSHFEALKRTIDIGDGISPLDDGE